MKKMCKVLCSIDPDGYFMAVGDSGVTDERLVHDLEDMSESFARLYWIKVELEVPEIPTIDTIRAETPTEEVSYVE
jgi:hypothetical protein